MKLIRYTYKRLLWLIFILFVLWGVVFYFSLMNEVMDETDDRLLNNKGIVVHRMLRNPSLLLTADTLTDQFHIRRISQQQGQHYRDRFFDDQIFIQIENEYEPVRVYQSSFKDQTGQYYEIELYLSTIERDNVIENVLFYLIVLFLLLYAILLVGIQVVLKRTFNPLYKLLQWINNATPGNDVPALVNDTEIAEFKMLNEATLQMQQRSHKAYNEQKEFIGNASHELQTPLAVALNKLEMLANSENLNELQLKLISDTFNTLHKASKINKSLLLLTQLQNEQAMPTKSCNLTQLIQKQWSDLLEIHEEKKIQPVLHLHDDFLVDMNDSLASVLIHNLIKNAVIHSPDNGTITITSTHHSLIFHNEGKEALDPNAIFRRFYRSNTASTKQSSGLGLALVKEIVQISKLEITYSFDNGHSFVLKKAK